MTLSTGPRLLRPTPELKQEEETPDEIQQEEVLRQEEQPIQVQQQEVAKQQDQQPIQGPRKLAPKQEIQPGETKEPKGKWEAFKRGLQHSASGELEQAILGSEKELIDTDATFWDRVVEESGSLVGDAPFMAAGATMGAALTAWSGPFAVVGAGFGALALPAFLKEASRQYRQFQDSGGNLTFGEFIERSGTIANSTLREGAFGAALSTVRPAMSFLKQVPGLDKLFNTRYIGSTIREGSTLGAEVGVATTLPAAVEGRLPDKEDYARAAVLFAGQKAAHMPAQIYDNIKESRSEKFNYALADRIEKLDLPYPPLEEFKQGANPVYKNSHDLDRSMTAFDKGYIQNVVSAIQSLSPREFMSSHEAGTAMKDGLAALMPPPVQPILPKTQAQEPVKPVKPVEVPLIQNPLVEAGRTISEQKAHSEADLGRQITKVYRENRRTERDGLERRYDDMEQETRSIQVVDENFSVAADTFLQNFGESIAPEGKEGVMIRSVRRLGNMFRQFNEEGEQVGIREVPLSQIIATVRSIKKIPSWEVPPELTHQLGEFTSRMDEMIAGHLENVNEDLGTEYLNLRNDYHSFKQRYDNSRLRVFHKRTENSQKIGKAFTGLDNFNQLSAAIGLTPEGQRVLNLLRREAWDNGVGKKALTASTEKEFAEATKDLDQGAFNNLMEYLTPQQRNAAIAAQNRANQTRSSVRQIEEQYQNNLSAFQRQMSQWRSTNKRNEPIQQQVQTKQELLVSLLKQDPALVVGNMKTIEGIKRMKEACDKVTDGKDLYNALARFETENMFDFMKESYIETGRAPYNKMKVQMQNREFRSKLTELNGKEFVKQMDELVELTDYLSENFKEQKVKYKDDPTTFNKILEVYSILALAHGEIMTPLVAFTAKKNLLKMGQRTYNMWLGNKNLDPDYVRTVIQAARAIKNGNKDKIRVWGSKLDVPYK